jgi:arabinan endo-1,5-alpha-L-arabinosidase
VPHNPSTLWGRGVLVERPAMENAIKGVHDPSIIKEGVYYYVFCTGQGIPVRRSRDLKQWEIIRPVFKEGLPEWTKREIPGSTNPWAPDIAYFNGRYHLYYSVSTFGKNRSLIGLVTNKTLDPGDKEYAWQDEGKAFESIPTDNYNAIDSNVLSIDRSRMVFLFGSFWTGIKMVESDPKTGKPKPEATVVPLARRPSPGAVEAPFLIRHGDYYYLFASYDLCCRGIRSTYHIRVGRAKKVEGPYLDRESRPLLEDGGTSVLQSHGRIRGPGHCAVLRDGSRYLLVNHFYDAEDNGVPTLQIQPLAWDKEGWPTVENATDTE